MKEVQYRAFKVTGTPEMFNDIVNINFEKGEITLKYKVSSWTTRNDVELLKNVRLMQYIGQKDINGVKIFEGDIVKHLFMNYAGHGEVDEIEEIIKISDMTNLPFNLSTLKVEVIGNIYEKPDLLKNISKK